MGLQENCDEAIPRAATDLAVWEVPRRHDSVRAGDELQRLHFTPVRQHWGVGQLVDRQILILDVVSSSLTTPSIPDWSSGRTPDFGSGS